MTAINPIQYTSRTFNSILNDINTDTELKDKPTWWKRIWAGVGDVISMIVNAQANQSYLETAFTEEAVDRLLELIDYQRTPHTTSNGTVLFYISRSASFPFTVALADLAALSEGSISASSKRFEAIAAETFTAVSETFTANASTNRLTVARAYTTGELVRLSTTGTLPTATGGDLDASTDYYVIYYSATEIYLARSLALALAGTSIDLTSTGSGTHTIALYSKQITLYQQTTIDQYSVGTSDGTTEWQEFDLADALALRETLLVEVNGVSYTRVDTFVYSSATDKHYKLINKSDNRFAIRFGNGTYGIIPPAFPVLVTYAYGGGVDSNIYTTNKINSYAGTDSNITGVCNPSTVTGGADRESIDTARDLAPVLLKTRDRFVTVEDGKSLALGYGGAIRCAVNKNVYGILSAQVVVVPTGGGAAPAPYLALLDTYLTNKSILESIDIRCVSATYSAQNISASVKIFSGYAWATVADYVELAICLLFSEVTYEIQQTYSTSGIAAAVTYINSKFTFTFTSADYSYIIWLLTEVTAHDFGVTINESDVLSILDRVPGVDYVELTAPAFPISFASDTISQSGTHTLTQIP